MLPEAFPRSTAALSEKWHRLLLTRYPPLQAATPGDRLWQDLRPKQHDILKSSHCSPNEIRCSILCEHQLSVDAQELNLGNASPFSIVSPPLLFSAYLFELSFCQPGQNEVIGLRAASKPFHLPCNASYYCFQPGQFVCNICTSCAG